MKCDRKLRHPAPTVDSARAVDRKSRRDGLDPGLRAEFEPRFDFDFSKIRIHADNAADGIAQEYDARALTVGRDIYFAEGEYNSTAPAGRYLIAHELAHVVQQDGSPEPSGPTKAIEKNSAAEYEAHITGSRAAAGHDVSIANPTPVAPALAPKRQLQIPQFSQSTEDQITALMHEHPGLTRVNAERAIQGPPGAVPKASGQGGTLATGTGSGDRPKTPDLEFRQITTRGSSVVLRREVKVVLDATHNLRLDDPAEQLRAGGGGELLMQVPQGTDARSLVQRYKGSVLAGPNALQKIGLYRSVRITIVDPSGAELLSEPLELPPSRTGTKSGGGGGTLTAVNPPAQAIHGEIQPGTEGAPKPPGATKSGGGGRTLAPVNPQAQETHGEIITRKGGPSKPEPTTEPKTIETTAHLGTPDIEPMHVGGPSAKGEAIGGGVVVGAQVKDWIMGYFGDKVQGARPGRVGYEGRKLPGGAKGPPGARCVGHHLLAGGSWQ